MQPVREDGPLPDDRTAFEQACDDLLAGARRSVRIWAADLDQQLLNRERVSELLVRLARHNPSARVRILIADASAAVSAGHRLIYLARRLPSFVSIRALPGELNDNEASWLLADDQALLWRPDYRHLRNGLCVHQDPMRSGVLLRLFDDRWEQARVDPSLRQLSL
ncbi:MAG: hypothetical protein ACK4SX_06265 [Alcanivoracaceae bacterium]